MEIFLIIFLIYIFLFLLSIKINDNSIVDIFWGTGFIIISTYFYIIKSRFSLIETLSLIIIIIWGLRLSLFILKRKLKEKKEDPRYAIWRNSWKYFYLRSFFQVYILQMLLMFIVVLPIYFIFSGKEINIYVFIIGFLVSLFGLLFEIISDFQLNNYIKNSLNKTKVFTGGLYKYSRNPNYFGESIFWLGLSIIGSSISLFSFIGYFVITFLLLFVSGVPLKEKRQEKKDNWKEYKSKTNKFIPWFKKI